jgi:hypothetical protein
LKKKTCRREYLALIALALALALASVFFFALALTLAAMGVARFATATGVRITASAIYVAEFLNIKIAHSKSSDVWNRFGVDDQSTRQIDDAHSRANLYASQSRVCYASFLKHELLSKYVLYKIIPFRQEFTFIPPNIHPRGAILISCRRIFKMRGGI